MLSYQLPRGHKETKDGGVCSGGKTEGGRGGLNLFDQKTTPRGESSTPGQLARCHMCTHEIHTGGAKAGLIQRVGVPVF